MDGNLSVGPAHTCAGMRPRARARVPGRFLLPADAGVHLALTGGEGIMWFKSYLECDKLNLNKCHYPPIADILT